METRERPAIAPPRPQRLRTGPVAAHDVPVRGPGGDFHAYATDRLPVLRRWAYTMCGDPHQADDLVQETLTTVYAKWSRVSQADNVNGYVHRMLIRTFLDDRRRGWWKVRLAGDTALERRDRPVQTAGVEDREILRAALHRLTPAQRSVLVLRFLCDQSVADVARQLGCSEGTIKSQTLRALTRMRRLLDEDGRSTAGGTPSAVPRTAPVTP